MKHLLMSEARTFGRIPRGTGHRSWASRDYLDVDCKATGCRYNVVAMCMVPSRCKIEADGRCQGFEAKPLPKKIDGD